jgi:2-polyprenyl-6-methoxyphenol hydroxylase-like FAD-dependent oxidoreductase
MPGANRFDVPVLIVGAGPVGLTMACELHRHGVPCRIVDQNAGPTPENESRALGIQPRTLEVLRNIGVVDRVLAQGRKLHGIGAYSDHRRIFHVTLDFEGIDTAYPFVIDLPQPRTERILLARLTEHGGAVERGMTLSGFIQDDGGVTATFETASGPTQQIRAGWLIGCDGARSVVRHALALNFEGGEYEERFLLADVHIDWPLPDDEMLVVLTPEGPLGAFPLPDAGRWRVVDARGAVDPGDLAGIVAAIREQIVRHVASGAVVDDPAWTSSFHIHRRVVDRYRVGRCFVGGDAAHLHSPFGGQGMNTGIQDAYNLAWKLALVIRGKARESLLDSYSAERRPVAKSVVKGTDIMTRVAQLRSEVAREIRNHLVAFLTEFDFVRRRLSLEGSELGVAYRQSPIVAEDRGRMPHPLQPREPGHSLHDYLDFSAAPHPGDRAPDVTLGEAHEGHPRRLQEALVGTQHTLLLFEGAAAEEGIEERLTAVASLIASRYADLIRPLLVHSPTRPKPARWSGEVFRDPESAIHHRYGAAASCLYLIRPDGYVGYRCQPIDADQLRAYLERLFV